MTAPALHGALARAAAGLPIDPDGLPPRAVRALAVADRLGAPRAPALRAAAAAARDAEDLAAAVAVAAAEGRSVARALVVAPPVIGPAAALLVTDAPMAVWQTPVGRALLVLALLLWGAGALVVRTLVARAAPGPRVGSAGTTEELLELAAIALGAGCGLADSLRRAADALGGDAPAGVSALALWLELGADGPVPSGWEQIGPPLSAARRDGVPLVALVRSLASAERRQHHQRALERAARLGARLTLPTTLLLLPAALVVVGAPLLHGALAAVT